MDGFNEQFIFSILIITLGYLVKRFDIIQEIDGEALSRIIFNITLPALILVTFHDLVMDYSLFLLLLIGVLYGFFAAALGIFYFRNQPRDKKGMLTMMVPGFNIGLFAYPLVEGIWGREGIQHFGMFDVGNSLIVFGLCYFIGSYYASEDAKLNIGFITKKLTRSIPLMTYAFAVTISLLGIKLPGVIIGTADIISKANMPLSLLLLGVYLNFQFEKKDTSLIYHYLFIKYVPAMIIGVLAFMFLPFGDMFKYTVLIGLILPVSMSVVPFSVELGYNTKFVGTISNITIIISFFLIWLIANFVV